MNLLLAGATPVFHPKRKLKMKNDFHRQCQVRQGDKLQTTWLPEEFAIKGRVLSLKESENWTGPWTVTQVFGREDSSEVNIRSRDHKKQRSASDLARGTRKRM